MAKDLSRNGTLLIITSGMMEITWLYALACVFFLMLNAPLFPIWAAMLAFFIPIIITSLTKGRGKRIIELFILHLLFYVLILTYTIYNYSYRSVSFLNLRWIQTLVNKQFGPLDGFAYFLLICWFSCVWFCGYKLANRSKDYFALTSRFDLGIVMLVLTFIISGSTNTLFPNASILISYYFLFSMLAIILAQNSRSLKTKFDSQFSKTKLIFTFIPVLLLLVSWAFLFFLPQMTSVAQASYNILKVVSNPIGKFLLKILIFLFGFGYHTTDISPTHSSDSAISLLDGNELSWLGKILQWILTWGGILLLILLTTLAIGWLLFSLWKWFSLKTTLDIEKKGFYEELWLWIKHIFFEVKKVLNNFFNYLIASRRKENISALFQKLCHWGKNSGIPRKKSQTPLEYGRHLAFFFPDSYQDIQLIIDSFNQERYGKKLIQSEELEEIKKAWRRLSSPSKWPLRLLTKIIYFRKTNLIEAISSHS